MSAELLPQAATQRAESLPEFQSMAKQPDKPPDGQFIFGYGVYRHQSIWQERHG
jgi:hypothetical protein